MTTTEAIKQLQTEHDLIAQERDLDGSQFAPALLEALAMAIEVMKCSEIPNCSEPKCADGCIYGWGSSECGHCDYRSEESKTGDCISRQVAIDEIKEIYEWHDNVTKERIIEHFVRLPSAQPERKISNKEWIDFLVFQFEISRTSAKEMLHGMMQWKKEDNFKKQFRGKQDG